MKVSLKVGSISGQCQFVYSNPIVVFSSLNSLDLTKYLAIKIHNFGLAPAKHVVGSLRGNNLTFSNITSKPFLSKYFRTNTNVTSGYRANVTVSNKDGFFDVDVLPPGSETSINSKVDVSKVHKDTQLIVYLRSDEAIGYVNYIVWLTLGFYIAFLVGAPIVFVYVYRKYV